MFIHLILAPNPRSHEAPRRVTAFFNTLLGAESGRGQLIKELPASRFAKDVLIVDHTRNSLDTHEIESDTSAPAGDSTGDVEVTKYGYLDVRRRTDIPAVSVLPRRGW